MLLSIGDVSLGHVKIAAVDGASVGYSLDIQCLGGKVGDVQFGDLTVTGGVSANVDVSNDVWASTDIRNVTTGDVSLSADLNGIVSAGCRLCCN